MDRFERLCPVIKQYLSRRIVMGEVLVPNLTDGQGDRVNRETIEKAAHDFLRQTGGVGENHRRLSDVGEVVESFIARPGDPDFTEGAWVMAVRCTPESWSRVQKGELTGSSIGGRARRLPDL